jgi:hypothetical protein
LTLSIFSQGVTAQDPEMQKKVAEVKKAVARNRQALAQSTWQEQVTISVNGEQRNVSSSSWP